MSVTGNPPTRAGAGAVLRGVAENIAAGLLLLRRPVRATFAARKPWLTSWQIAACVLILAAAALWQMAMFDAAMAARARHLPRWLGLFFREATDFGKSGWFLWPIGLMLIAIAVIAAFELARIARLVLAALAVRLTYVFLAIGLPGLFVAVVKRMIGRQRPPMTDVVGDPFSYAPFAWKAAFAGMPSGHATTAFAAAFAVGALWPRARPAMWVFAAVIAVSRVAVSAHYPSDVFVGAAAGLVGALLVRNYFAARGLVFSAPPNGEIRAMPGPSLSRIKRVARAVAGP